MNHENHKPSEVIYVFLNAIANVVLNLAKLTGLLGGYLWMAGMRLIKLAPGPTSNETKPK